MDRHRSTLNTSAISLNPRGVNVNDSVQCAAALHRPLGLLPWSSRSLRLTHLQICTPVPNRWCASQTPSGRCSASPNSEKCRQSASCASSPKTRCGNRRLLGGKKASQFPTLFLLVLAATIAAINRTHTYGSVGWTAERYWGGALQTIVRISSEGPSR